MCSLASMFLFSIHTLQFTSLTWYHCRNTCWSGYSCVIDCYSWFSGCLHFLCYGAWLSFEQSLLVTFSSVICFVRFASRGSSFYLFWSFFVCQTTRSSFSVVSWFSMPFFYNVLMFEIVYLFFSPCGYLS